MDNNDTIIARIKGVHAQSATRESNADPCNPNIVTLDADAFAEFHEAIKPRGNVINMGVRRLFTQR